MTSTPTSSLWYAWYLLADAEAQLGLPPLMLVVGLGVDGFLKRLLQADTQLLEAESQLTRAGLWEPRAPVDLLPESLPMWPARGPVLWYRSRSLLRAARVRAEQLRHVAARALASRVDGDKKALDASCFTADDDGAGRRRRGSLNRRASTTTVHAAG